MECPKRSKSSGCLRPSVTKFEELRLEVFAPVGTWRYLGTDTPTAGNAPSRDGVVYFSAYLVVPLSALAALAAFLSARAFLRSAFLSDFALGAAAVVSGAAVGAGEVRQSTSDWGSRSHARGVWRIAGRLGAMAVMVMTMSQG